MPDAKILIPALVGLAALVAVGGVLGWLLDHPVEAILFVAVAGGGIVLLIRRNRMRKRV